MLKEKKRIIPTCIPCERRVEKEFGTIPEYLPVIQSRLHDDGDDDKATDAHDPSFFPTIIKQLMLMKKQLMLQYCKHPSFFPT